MRKFLLSIMLLPIFAFANETVSIWKGVDMPGKITAQFKMNDDGRIVGVANPELEIFTVKNPKGAMIICPGGGYSILAYTHEGIEIAKFLNENGYSAFVLKYRVPKNRDSALMDAQRAIRYLRKNAEEFGINPEKIAIMGFSAGANLSARASTLFDENSYKAIDDIDKVSAKPNLTCLIYPAYCDMPAYTKHILNKKGIDTNDYDKMYELAADLKITKDTPPAFIIQTQKDKTWVNSSIAYYLALKNVGVAADLHMFSEGVHGYGLRIKDKPVKDWGRLMVEWLNYQWQNRK